MLSWAYSHVKLNTPVTESQEGKEKDKQIKVAKPARQRKELEGILVFDQSSGPILEIASSGGGFKK